MLPLKQIGKVETGLQMKIILHIGQGKAGSTAIQDSLFKARHEIRSHGCLYPDTLHIKGRHHWLSPLVLEPKSKSSVVHRMGFNVDAAKQAARDEWVNLSNQIEHDRPSHLILSSEVLFSTYSQHEIDSAKKYLPSLSDDVRVLAYVRSPVSRYLSLVQQSLKSTNGIVQPSGTRVINVFNSYEAIFGRKVEVRVFERSRLRSEDAVADFIDWSDLPLPKDLVPTLQSNESTSAEAMAVLREISPVDAPTNMTELLQKRRRFRAVLRADREIAQPTKPRLKPEIAEYIARQSSELIQQRDDYGLEFSDIDYSIVGKPPSQSQSEILRIDEICDYDKDRMEILKAKALDYNEAFNRAAKEKERSVPDKGVFNRLKSLVKGW